MKLKLKTLKNKNEKLKENYTLQWIQKHMIL